MKVFITFGQAHVHRVNGKTFDCDSVAILEGDDYAAARAKTFALFADKWHHCTEDLPEMSYYPRGLICAENPNYVNGETAAVSWSDIAVICSFKNVARIDAESPVEEQLSDNCSHGAHGKVVPCTCENCPVWDDMTGRYGGGINTVGIGERS